MEINRYFAEPDVIIETFGQTIEEVHFEKYTILSPLEYDWKYVFEACATHCPSLHSFLIECHVPKQACSASLISRGKSLLLVNVIVLSDQLCRKVLQQSSNLRNKHLLVTNTLFDHGDFQFLAFLASMPLNVASEDPIPNTEYESLFYRCSSVIDFHSRHEA